ncbi:hypothetical protein [Demequina gelatinilytica]|uniref:hypothetical protein n=1 Tax=Demequina gelatinilytica TaxID=1638980 RepID=UPI0007838C99|nr:hypothetical protein [Demequina gelatinilytica]
MDDVPTLVAQARLAIDIAHARLIAARRARWQGIHGETYRGELSEAAARVTAVSEAVRIAALAGEGRE